jgi:hypothetical protein
VKKKRHYHAGFADAREFRELRALVVRLARALYTHTRTDIAPDAALPEMRRIVADLTKEDE